MADDLEIKPLGGSELRGSTEDFTAYCEAEFERRRNSGEAFDEAAYREAMELTLARLRTLSEEGYS